MSERRFVSCWQVERLVFKDLHGSLAFQRSTHSSNRCNLISLLVKRIQNKKFVVNFLAMLLGLYFLVQLERLFILHSAERLPCPILFNISCRKYKRKAIKFVKREKFFIWVMRNNSIFFVLFWYFIRISSVAFLCLFSRCIGDVTLNDTAHHWKIRLEVFFRLVFKLETT